MASSQPCWSFWLKLLCFSHSNLYALLWPSSHWTSTASLVVAWSYKIIIKDLTHLKKIIIWFQTYHMLKLLINQKLWKIYCSGLRWLIETCWALAIISQPNQGIFISQLVFPINNQTVSIFLNPNRACSRNQSINWYKLLKVVKWFKWFKRGGYCNGKARRYSAHEMFCCHRCNF